MNIRTQHFFRTSLFYGCFWAVTTWTAFGLDVYLLRHAETIGNVTGNYTEENQRLFSPNGERQIRELTERLRKFHFDHIFVSPTYRTRRTILPYLQKAKRRAEIWPELEECCCDSRGRVAPAAKIPLGPTIELARDETKYFRLRADGRQHLAPVTEAEGLAMIYAATRRLLEAYAGTTQTVLLVTHSCSGSRIMEVLLGLKPSGRFAPANAALSLLSEITNGKFRLVIYNDAPYEQKYLWVPMTDAEARPGEPYILGLVPRFFGQQAESEYVVEWKLLKPGGEILLEGSLPIPNMTESREEDSVLETIALPTDKAKVGDVWTLYSKLVAGGRVIDRWSMQIPFPKYMSLSGTWQVEAGDDARWADPDFRDFKGHPTRVPGNWESDALPNFDGIAWYRYEFEIPESKKALWGTSTLAFVAGAIDDADETFFNGVRIGAMGSFPPDASTAWDQPRIYEVPSHAIRDTNVIAIRVADWGGGGGIWKGPVALGRKEELLQSIAPSSTTR